jgi:hypothetical protein
VAELLFAVIFLRSWPRADGETVDRMLNEVKNGSLPV